MLNIVYTTKKAEVRIEKIKTNQKLASLENASYKFEALKKSAFDDDFTVYKTALDDYHKALSFTKDTAILDSYLKDCLVCLCADSETIEKVVKANLHMQIKNATYKFSQKMIPATREKLKQLKTALELAENGIIDGEKVIPQKANTEVSILKSKIETLKASNVYEVANFKQVNPNQFRKQFELFLGGFLNGYKVISDFVTIEEREHSKKWERYKKQCSRYGIGIDTYRRYLSAGDAEGMKKAIAEAKNHKAIAEEVHIPAIMV